MDFGSSAEHCVQVCKLLLKQSEILAQHFIFVMIYNYPKKPHWCAHYHILACHCGDGKCSSLLAIAVSVVFLQQLSDSFVYQR